MKTFSKSVELTAAQVNSLGTAGITIIPASKANTLIEVDEVTFAKLSGTAAGTVGTSPITLVYTGSPTVDIVGFASNTTSQTFLATGAAASAYLIVTQRPAVAGVNFTQAQALGKGVDIVCDGGTVAAFDGTLQVTVKFRLTTIG